MQAIDCILLIDKDSVSNYVSEALIRKYKLSQNILIALNCKEALKIIRNVKSQSGKAPGLILMESNIRFEEDKYYKELEAFIESNKEQVQVVMLTNIIGNKDLAMVKSSGVEYVLCKPLTGESLMDVIRHFQSRRLSGSAK
jgi:response regulator of citrate/malate metabolism